MKNIAVVIHSLIIEYSIEILQGITDYFKDKDVRIITAQTKTPHSDEGLYEYQYWINSSFVSSDEIDEVIILAGSYSYYIRDFELSKIFNTFKNKPVVTIAIPLNFPNSSCTKIDCRESYKSVIKHLKKVHNCKKIAFFSGNPTKAPESFERFDAYKEALSENGFEFDPNLVLDGFLLGAYARQIIIDTYKSAKEVPFDAILCVNDTTAIGCIHGLRTLNIRIPEDVKVIGFDDIAQATYFTPSLSTISQNLYQLGLTSAETAYKKLNGIDVPQTIVSNTEAIYRQSCGCISSDDSKKIYKNQKLKLCKTADDLHHYETSINYSNFLSVFYNFSSILDTIQAATTLKALFHSMNRLMYSSDIGSCEICLYDSVIYVDKEEDFKIPDSINLEMFINIEENISIFEPGISFNPKQSLFPKGYSDEQSGNFLIQPIFSGQKQYGYMLCKLRSTNYAVYNIFLKLIASTVAQAFEYTYKVNENQQLSNENKRLQIDNSDLEIKSRTDELTQVLNLRGFLEFGQQTIDMALKMGSNGLVFFTDMDGLKKINDSYGHKTGDLAIKTQAQILSNVMRSNDIIGRIGGDEFAIVATGMELSQINDIRKKIKQVSQTISKENGFDFTISCSFGVYQFDKNHYDLKELLKEADNDMYIEKKQKHSKNNS